MCDGKKTCPEENARARSIACRILSARPHTEYELAEKLRARGLNATVVEQIIFFLKEYGMLDDAAFARSYINQRMQSRPAGKTLLFAELRHRGVPSAIIETILEDIDGDTEYDMALRLVMKRKSLSGDCCRPAKIASFLWRRGFSSETIKRICKELETAQYPDIS